MNQTPEFWKWAKATPEELLAQNEALLDFAAGRINTARAIVKALADGGPYTDREYGDCTLCGADYSFPSMGMVHESNCPYWMAVDFMAAKGEK